MLLADIKLTPTEFGNLQKMDGPTERCQDPAPEPPTNCLTGFVSPRVNGGWRPAPTAPGQVEEGAVSQGMFQSLD